MKALVVEPDADARARLVAVLSARGHEVFAMASHAVALDQLRSRTDLHAVVTDGDPAAIAALTRGVRSLPDGEEVFVMALVPPDAPEALRLVLDAGASDYFLKPLDVVRMDAMLRVAERTVALTIRRRQAEATLRRERDFVATVLDTVASLVVVLDRKGTVIRFNRACEDLTGISAQEVQGRPFQGFIPESEVPAVNAVIERLWAGESPVYHVNHWITRDRGLRLISWRNGMFRAAVDGEDYLIGTGLDITDRNRAEAALQESEGTLRSFYDSAPFMMGLIEPLEPWEPSGFTPSPDAPAGLGAMVYRSCNATLARMFRTEPDTMRGRRVSSLGLPEDLLAMWYTRCAEADATGLPVHFEYAHGEGAAQQWFSATITRTSVEAMGTPRFCLIVEDVTERKKLQARLLLADRMVSVGTLAAGVAHEINNPLMYVIANLEFMGKQFETAVAPDRRERLDRAMAQAREGGERVRQIVRNLRTFSRGDEDRRGPVMVQQVLESSIDMAWNEIRHRARLVRDYRPVAPVEANDARLGQVFLNLLVNAAQAIPEGQSGSHEIRVSTATDAMGRVVVSIQDSGRGIARETIGRIFDPFFTTKPIGVGTGLGLSICHGIITALGGEITVDSEVGSGSVFRVALPASTTRDAPRRQSTPPAAPGRRGRVLVVDDEPNLRSSLGQILSVDHDVTTAGSAREVLQSLVGGTRYDAILCDLMMPEMSGIDLHDELIKVVPEQVARMIFLTGGAFTPRAQDFLERVPNPRLEKPFDLDELRALIRKIVR